VRSGVDRRQANHGPPEGVPERRHNDRRSHDRRSHQRTDRRSRERRLSTGRRGSASGPRHLTRAAQPRTYVAPAAPKRSRTGKLIRGLVITLVALACLLAATLTESPNSGGTVSLTESAAQVLHLGDDTP
jgi:hypothetical protein